MFPKISTSPTPRFLRTRISGFNQPLLNTHKRGYRNSISTLDPKKLTPDDYIDLSGSVYRKLKLPSVTHNKEKNPYIVITYSHLLGKRNPQPYTDNAKGFLVYHSPYPDKAPELGQVVFRLVPTPDPSLVSSAPMYIKPDTHLPWSIPLFDIINYKTYHLLLRQLLHDGLITPELRDNVQRLSVKHRPHKRTAILCTTGQTWLFDFEHPRQYFFVLGHGRIVKCDLPWLSSFEYAITPSVRLRAIKGKAIVAFEMFRHRLYIRIVEVVEPICSTVSDTKVFSDFYVPGAYIPFHLTSPLFNTKPRINALSPAGGRAVDPSAPWFVDPYDLVRRDVQHLKGLRLLLDKPLTKHEEMVFDLSREERLQKFTEMPDFPAEEERADADEQDTVESLPENKVHIVEDHLLESGSLIGALIKSTRKRT